MKKQIDVELFLQFTIEELAKGAPIAQDSWGLIERVGQLGTRVDTSYSGPNLGFLEGEPHPDAKAAALALKAMPRSMMLPSAIVPLLLGNFANCDPDAAGALLKASFNAISLVIVHATKKNRPVWDIGEPRPGYRQRDNGAPIIYGLTALDPSIDPMDSGFDDLIELKALKRGGYDLNLAPRALLTWDEPAPIAYGESRAEYLVWYLALVAIANRLARDGNLIEHEVLPPAAPREPWNEPSQAPPRILQSQATELRI